MAIEIATQIAVEDVAAFELPTHLQGLQITLEPHYARHRVVLAASMLIYLQLTRYF